ncbi:hypothetical protein BGZ73_009034 [Actinomortierella ambigua]|nr:hypothetical protein BGZ73_009034 [Actinomortierella ambigua]
MHGGLNSTSLGTLTSSNSPFRGLSSIGGGGGGSNGGVGGADLLTSAERDHSKDLQVEKSRLLEQLRYMREDVDELEAQLQALRRKKARSNTISQAQQQRKRAKEALDMKYEQGGEKRSQGYETGKQSALLQQLRSFTNISFTQIQSQLEPFEDTSVPSTKSSTLPRTDNSPGTEDDDALLISKSRHYHYQGSCYELDFDVKFIVREPDLVLEGLMIKVPTGVEAEIGTFLEKAEKDSSLLLFFRTFHRYAQMNYQRKKLWNKFARQYPHLVAMASLNKDQPSAATTSSTLQRKRRRNVAILPGQDGIQVLTFRSSRRADMELVFNWRIHVDQHGHLTPLLRLLPKVTTLWKQSDQKAVVENLPIQFLRLVEMKGVQGAVVTILKSVYGQEATAVTTSSRADSESGDDLDGSDSETETIPLAH